MSKWVFDADSGFVFTPSGARAFRLDASRMAVLVYDKRARAEVAIPLMYLVVMLLLGGISGVLGVGDDD